MNGVRKVSLPAELCEAAEKKFEREFGNVEELLSFILGELARDQAIEAIDEREQRLVEERLRELGYL